MIKNKLHTKIAKKRREKSNRTAVKKSKFTTGEKQNANLRLKKPSRKLEKSFDKVCIQICMNQINVCSLIYILPKLNLNTFSTGMSAAEKSYCFIARKNLPSQWQKDRPKVFKKRHW